MDKSREDFEEYFEDAYGWEAGDYPDQTFSTEVWNAWQTSRKALVVELPKQGEVTGSYDTEAFWVAVERCEDAIRAVGLTVEGGWDEQTNVLSP